MNNDANMEGKMPAIYIMNDFCKSRIDERTQFVRVDNWYPSNVNEVIVNCKPGYFIVPFHILFNLDIDASDKMDYFMLSTKKCYNSAAMRTHLFQYINYFCNYYDPEWEYISVLFNIKLKVDRYPNYSIGEFFYDIERYIIQKSIIDKVGKMIDDNYYQELNYTNIKTPSLQYTNEHAKLLHKMSVMMDLCIPLLTHYAYMHKVNSIDEYLLTLYDKILHMDNTIDIYSKLYDTAYTNVVANQKNNQGIWIKQDIRSIDTTTHSTDSVHNIILNIMPKYTFDKNIISFNYASIRKNTSYKITDISFEYSYVAISSSKRDNDSISDFDKFESNLIRMNEGLYLQNKVNCQICMNNIESKFGPFDQNEIDHLTSKILVNPDGSYMVDSFQKNMIFSLFYRWFGDTQSIQAINRDQYVKLMISAKKLLSSNNMIILPYIMCGKVEKFVSRKTVNKKERIFVESSPSYPMLLDKYKNENVIDYVFSIMATIISSDFSIVDMDPNIDGKRLDIIAIGVLIEEIITFILMV